MVAVIIISILVLVVGIVLAFFAPCMNSNVVSMIGGLLSASATVLLGFVAFLQNKKYKQLSDAANKRTEELMFTPEFHVQMIHNQSYAGEIPEMNISVNNNSTSCKQAIVCNAVNIPIIRIDVESIQFINGSNTSTFSKKDLQTNMIGGISIVIPEHSFSIRVSIPEEYCSVQWQCQIAVRYENIYQSRFEKEFVIKTLGGINDYEVVSITKAHLIEQNNV